MNHFRKAVYFILPFLSALSSCSVLEISKEVEFDIIFPIHGDDPLVEDTYLFDLLQYSSEYEDYMDNVRDIDIQSITFTVTDFAGDEEQSIDDGELYISDENGGGTQLLANLPGVNLSQAEDLEHELDLEPAGLERAEELILNAPNTCLSSISVMVNSTPVAFNMKFHVKALVSGTLL